jgi:uncharacterized membrane protein YdbT with pleckstrin-like domain
MDVLPSAGWTAGLYLVTLGLWGIWRRRTHFVLTNQRIVLTKGVLNKTERSAPLTKIQDSILRRSVFNGGSVTLSTAGGPLGIEQIGPLGNNVAIAFHDALTPLLGGATAAQAPTPEEIARRHYLRLRHGPEAHADPASSE